MYRLPLFPLDAVLFPGTPVFLHIFEPRYKLMINECLDTGRPFGVVLIRQGMEALGPLAEPHSIGCTARIVHYDRLEDGQMNLVAMGDERFRIQGLDNSQPYLSGEVESIYMQMSNTLQVLRYRPVLKRLITQYADVLQEIGSAEYDPDEFHLPDDPLPLMYQAASLLQVPAIEKQPLLVAGSLRELFLGVWRLYRREVAVLAHLSKVDEKDAARAALVN
jgi:uncharacterized protein